ncbi:hypothetical protein FGG08_000440 [Glutinoglossum americanum]|uniref:Uncharacterized protein n=1 Tax=Glutinoglossum americanum TaxID=1670608 RepID=A0A9P8I917_9PEZI|nr:hypothetical protein FGG08_000440 [Glutinoglossum americanum]
MSSIGRLTAATANATLDIAPALANLNFDFSLYKVEAPKEFQGVGASLSALRREEAEGGRPHVTARKLGALFERLLPPTPELFKAYGRRASEISQASIANSERPSNYGVFANQVGTDATSLWAAATSGQGAIAVHLLACMLARIWDGPEAISIWVEIVEKRKKEVCAAFEQTDVAELITLAAARQELTRGQMAEWDGSARAWLRAADAVKNRQLTQLRLIVDNVRQPVNKKTDTYASVINAWTNSLSQMEALIKGIPQRAQGGDLLLSLHSWHLFPDMMVVHPSTTHVSQRDPIFSTGGILTVGLQEPGHQLNGVYWSLPLAHLRHYGAPVVAVRSINSIERSRISLDEFLQALLGCVLQGWGIYGTDTSKITGWLSRLKDILIEVDSGQLLISGKGSFSWFALLLDAANYYLTSVGDERTIATKLVSLGRRHGKTFLGSTMTPLFGLLHYGRFVNIIREDDDRIQFLRKVAKKIMEEVGLRSTEIFIRYRRHYPGWSKYVYEYATALPWPREAPKRRLDQSRQASEGHRRWLYSGGDLRERVSDARYLGRLNDNYEGISHAVPTDFKRWHSTRRDSVQQHPLGTPDHPLFETDRCLFTPEESIILRGEYETRKQFYSSTGEDIVEREGELIEDFAAEKMGIFWDSMGQLDRAHQTTRISRGAMGPTGAVNLTPWYKFLYGNIDSAALFVLEGYDLFVDLYQTAAVEIPEFYSHFESGKVDPKAVVEELQSVLGVAGPGNDPLIMSLRAVSTAAVIYKNFSNGSIDVRILQQPLCDAYWVVECEKRHKVNYTRVPSGSKIPEIIRPYRLDRAGAFACITLFDSGRYNVRPDELRSVVAMSSGDSIFVGEALLCDPSEVPPAGNIKRIVGNIGRPGTAFLVPPVAPLIKEVSVYEWPQITRLPFDGQIQDRFKNTSLHLSFTGASSPLNLGFSGGQDTELYLLETLISVHDTGRWIADLDIYKAFQNDKLYRIPPCNVTSHRDNIRRCQLTCIDDWLELVDPPEENGSIVRAHKNWQARLAALAISVALDYPTFVLPEDICWQCLEFAAYQYTRLFSKVIAIA